MFLYNDDICFFNLYIWLFSLATSVCTVLVSCISYYLFNITSIFNIFNIYYFIFVMFLCKEQENVQSNTDIVWQTPEVTVGLIWSHEFTTLTNRKLLSLKVTALCEVLFVHRYIWQREWTFLAIKSLMWLNFFDFNFSPLSNTIFEWKTWYDVSLHLGKCHNRFTQIIFYQNLNIIKIIFWELMFQMTTNGIYFGFWLNVLICLMVK